MSDFLQGKKGRSDLLRKLIAGRETIVAPGAYDALTARIIEQAGFPAVYVTGFGATASLLGRTFPSSRTPIRAAAIHHMENKVVVSASEMVEKIHAAIEARTSPDFLIIARADAHAVEGLDSALRRARNVSRGRRPCPLCGSAAKRTGSGPGCDRTG